MFSIQFKKATGLRKEKLRGGYVTTVWQRHAVMEWGRDKETVQAMAGVQGNLKWRADSAHLSCSRQHIYNYYSINISFQNIDYFYFEDSIQYLKINMEVENSRKSQCWAGKEQLSK